MANENEISGRLTEPLNVLEKVPRRQHFGPTVMRPSIVGERCAPDGKSGSGTG